MARVKRVKLTFGANGAKFVNVGNGICSTGVQAPDFAAWTTC